MKTVSWAGPAASALLLGHLGLAAAENARLRYVAALYTDAAGGAMSLPEGVACDANGQLVVGDTGNDRLIRFTYRDKAVSGGSEIKIPQVSAPARVQLSSKGDIYALDLKQRRIARLGPAGEFKGVLTFDGVPPPATVVPKDFVIDAADTIYVLDVFSARVLVLDAEARFQRALPFPDGTGAGTGIAVDIAGTILLLDGIKRRMHAAPKDAQAFAPFGGDLTQFVPTLPTYMTSSKGIIFVVEGGGGSIAGFGRDASFLARQLGMGWNEGQLNHPAQMCVNDKDEVFIADRDNSRVQVFQLMR